MSKLWAKKNFAYGTVLTPPSPAASGTTLVLGSGQGARFPAPSTEGSYPITIWPINEVPTPANAEIATVTARTSDTLTIVRAQEGSSARTIGVGDQVAASISAQLISDLGAANSFVVSQTGHGFAAGNSIYWNGSAWALANAGSDTTVGTHIVGQTLGANAFIAVSRGRVTIASHGLGTAGQLLYTSASTSGALTATQPIPWINPMLRVESTDVVNVAPFHYFAQETPYKIEASVSSGALTVALKHIDGTDASTTRPINVRIGDSIRQITAALLRTIASGTDWMGLGSQFWGVNFPLCVYLLWNTTPATPRVTIMISRIPHSTVYSQFSTTSTDKFFAAYNGANQPQSTDVCRMIGSLKATMGPSAGGYQWSSPGSVKSYTEEWTDFVSFAPSLTGFSADPIITSCKYLFRMSVTHVEISYNQFANGTSNATSLNMALPFTSVTDSNYAEVISCSAVDNGTQPSTPARAWIGSNSTIVEITKDWAGSVFTASGNKRAFGINMKYRYRNLP